MTNENIYRKAIETYGAYGQTVVAVEELSELQKELCKAIRNGLEPDKEHLAEEMADVYIMLEQMEMLYDVQDIALWKASKIERLKNRLAEDTEEEEVNV